MLYPIKSNLKRLVHTLFVTSSCAVVLNLMACQQKLDSTEQLGNSRRNNEVSDENSTQENSTQGNDADEKERELDDRTGTTLPDKPAHESLTKEQHIKALIEEKTLAGMPLKVESLDLEEAQARVDLQLPFDFDLTTDLRGHGFEEYWSDFKSIDIRQAANYEIANIVGRKFSINFSYDPNEDPLNLIVTFAVQED